jgi:hypothetical protein
MFTAGFNVFRSKATNAVTQFVEDLELISAMQEGR